MRDVRTCQLVIGGMQFGKTLDEWGVYERKLISHHEHDMSTGKHNAAVNSYLWGLW